MSCNYGKIKLILAGFIAISLISSFSYTKSLSDEQIKQIREEEQRIKEAIKDKSNKELILLISSNDSMRARMASQILADRKDSSAVPGLIKLLKSEKRNIKQLASIPLGEIGDVRAVDALMEVFNKAEIKAYRIIPLTALCKIDDPRSYSLIESNIDDISSDLILNDPSARSLGLLQDAYIEMKLRELNEEDKIEKLINILKNKRMDLVITGKIVKFGKAIIPDLIQVVKDKHNNYSARNTALTCIGGIRDDRWVLPLTEILIDETEDDKLRDFTARLLGMSKDKRAIPVLEKVIKAWQPKAEDKNVVITKTGEKKYLYNVKETAEKALENINK